MLASLWEKVRMHIDWNILLTALGLALVLEGLPYALFANRLPAVLAEIARREPGALRALGLCAICAGVFLIWLVRG